MALINITPVMTSNTTPAPYVASASSELVASSTSTDYAYRAFDKDLSTMPRIFWHSALGEEQWLQLDFGSNTIISAFSITAHEANMAPTTFSLSGSYDNKNFETIYFAINYKNWEKGVTRVFNLTKDYDYRYYRIDTQKGNGYGYIVLKEVNFLRETKDEEIPEIVKESRLYCLPKADTFTMQNRMLDPREGLLGFANDEYNYGTLWMINSHGNAEIVRSAMANHVLLFDGFANTLNSIYTLTDTLNKYKYLIVIAGVSSTHLTFSTLIPTDYVSFANIATTTTNQYLISQYANNNTATHIRFIFTDTMTFKITEVLQTNWNMGIVKILGIK